MPASGICRGGAGAGAGSASPGELRRGVPSSASRAPASSGSGGGALAGPAWIRLGEKR
jgi:hypothetical protein